MTTSEERLSRLESAYEHLATKPDVESVKVDVESVKVAVEALKVEIARQEARLIKWMVGTVVTGIATATAVVMAVERLF